MEAVSCEICHKSVEESGGSVNCAVCDKVLHCSCAGLLQSHVTEIATFRCFVCEAVHGETEYNGKVNKHRRNFVEEEAEKKPVETCTPMFIEELKYRQFPRIDEILKTLSGHKLTLQYLQDEGFNVPVLVKDKGGLDMKLPPDYFDVSSICEFMGKNFIVDVVDVTQQSAFQMRIQDFLSYFFSEHRKFPVCIPSLEISNTRLEDFVQSPSIARELDWVEKYWPEELSPIKPCLQKYCSVSTKDAYVDFHITYGGSSVWYYIFEGEEVFYLIEPTTANLNAFQKWMKSQNKSETFFASKVDTCYQLVMKKGETVFLPTGWIYACLTLSDCLVFGGNFLHDLNIPFQLRIHDIESETSGESSSFPMFELLHIYAGFQLLEELQKFNQAKSKLPENKLFAIKTFTERIKFWVHSKDHKIFKHIKKLECQKLVKDLSKQVKQVERFYKSLKVTKPGMKAEVNKHPEDFIGSFLKEEEKSLGIKVTLKKVSTPVKLTLPKPTTYPYRNNKIATDGSEEMSKTPGELIEHPWSITDASRSNGDLKIKIRIGRQSPDVQKIGNNSQSTSDSSFQSRFKANSNSSNESKRVCESGPINTCTPLRQNETTSQASSPSATKDITAGDADSNSCGSSSSDLEVLYIGNNAHKKNKRKHLEYVSSDTFGKLDDEGDLMSSSLHSVTPHSSLSDSTSDLTTLSSPLSSTLQLNPNQLMQSPSLRTSTAISEILFSSSNTETGKYSILTTAADLHPWKSPPEGRKTAGLVQMGSVLSAVDEKPTASRTVGSPMRSRISLSGDGEGVLSICSKTRPKRKKKIMSRRQKSKTAAGLEDGQTEIGRVHEDDSFVYLSLETSDEEEEPVRKFRGKQYIDETWCPGARLGPLLPRVEKPVRDVKRNQAIEKGLEAAAAKKAGLPPPKRPYHIRKKRVPKCVTSSSVVTPAPTSISPSSAVVVSPPAVTSKRKSKKLKKPKRGMATAKQRLGKILKMNKMTF